MQQQILNCALGRRCSKAEPISADQDYSVRILRSSEEVETVRREWTEWQKHPNVDLDQYLLVCSLRKNVQRPHVIVVSRLDKPSAILVARLENGLVAPNIGYFKPIQFPITSVSVLYKGLLGRVDEVITKWLLRALVSTLNSGGADVVELYQLDEECPLMQAALREVPLIMRDRKPTWSTHWQLTLSDQPGALLKKVSSKHRSWIRRKQRELEQAFPAKVSYRTFSPMDDIDALCSDLETVACTTYQRSLSSGFLNDAEHRERFALFQRHGALRAWTLCIDKRPKAFCLGFVYGAVFYFSETGYDPSFRSYEIGTLIFLHMTDQLIREGIVTFDFGFGDAYYKKRFGDCSWREASLRLYAPTARGLAAHGCTEAFDITTSLGRSLVTRLGLLDKLKTAWRRRLAARATAKSNLI